MKDLQTSKAEALEAYKAARKAYLENMSNENWITFCDARIECMHLGVRI